MPTDLSPVDPPVPPGSPSGNRGRARPPGGRRCPVVRGRDARGGQREHRHRRNAFLGLDQNIVAAVKPAVVNVRVDRTEAGQRPDARDR